MEMQQSILSIRETVVVSTTIVWYLVDNSKTDKSMLIMIWEVVQIWSQLVCALMLYIALFLTLRKYRKDKMLRETPDLQYIFYRYQAKKMLNCKSGKRESHLDNLRQNTW